MFDTQKDAIALFAGINKRKLKRMRAFGMENDGIFSYKDKIYKISSSKREFLAANKIKGKDFNNVVKIFGTYECDILGRNRKTLWKSFILEEEKLKRLGKSYAFDDFDLQRVCCDVGRRLPYFVGILNGLAELASIGIEYNDLHPLNVMYDEKEAVKIIDFGFATIKRKYPKMDMRLSLKMEGNDE